MSKSPDKMQKNEQGLDKQQAQPSGSGNCGKLESKSCLKGQTNLLIDTFFFIQKHSLNIYQHTPDKHSFPHNLIQCHGFTTKYANDSQCYIPVQTIHLNSTLSCPAAYLTSPLGCVPDTLTNSLSSIFPSEIRSLLFFAISANGSTTSSFSSQNH